MRHGCSYCYARPYHEYLGWSAGLDFETKILVKEKAPELLREFLGRESWVPELIAMSGVTDCYQPAERHYRLTRGCLEVAVEAQQPMGIITKNALVLRDLDILGPMAAANLVRVHLSITTLDAGLARSMEPRTSTPAARLRAVKELTEAGVPVRVLVAPIIPGLNDAEVPAILQAVKEAGAIPRMARTDPAGQSTADHRADSRSQRRQTERLRLPHAHVRHRSDGGANRRDVQALCQTPRPGPAAAALRLQPVPAAGAIVLMVGCKHRDPFCTQFSRARILCPL